MPNIITFIINNNVKYNKSVIDTTNAVAVYGYIISS